MAIDWITIAAQIINFLILVWLLRRFLYGPVIRAIAEREKTIRTRLENAERVKQEADAEAVKLRKTRGEIEDRRHELLADARSEAEEVRSKLEREAREEIEKRAEAWRHQVDEERAAFIADLRQRSTEHFYDLAREALGGLAGKSLNDAIVDRFIERLPEADKEMASTLREETEGAKITLRIESSFELSPGLQERISAAIRNRNMISPEAEIDYTHIDDLICGIRLRADGQRIVWSLGDYLDRLESRAQAGLGRLSETQQEAAE